jgi:hypothetical protein
MVARVHVGDGVLGVGSSSGFALFAEQVLERDAIENAGERVLTFLS